MLSAAKHRLLLIENKQKADPLRLTCSEVFQQPANFASLPGCESVRQIYR
jgi:hypothetical protein